MKRLGWTVYGLRNKKPRIFKNKTEVVLYKIRHLETTTPIKRERIILK